MTEQNNHQPHQAPADAKRPDFKVQPPPADPIGINQAIGTPMPQVRKFFDPETTPILDAAARSRKWLVAVVYNEEGTLHCHVKRNGLTIEPGTDGESDVEKAGKHIAGDIAKLLPPAKPKAPPIQLACDGKLYNEHNKPDPEMPL